MKQIIVSVSIVALTAMLVGTVALAADTGQVTATVTASVIAVTVSDGAVAYGVVATTRDTTSDEANDTQTITNTGTVTEDFEIKGNDSASWELADAAGDAAYAHKSCIATCDTTPTWTAFNETAYMDLDTSKATSATTALDLQVTVPTANAGVTEQSIPVDILATAS